MKVLIYSSAFAPRVGGVETFVMLLAQGLTKWGCGTAKTLTVTVVTQTSRGDFDDAALPFGVVRRPTLRKLCRLAGETDVLHLAGPAFLPLLVGFLLRKPIVIEHHGFQAACPNGQLLYEPTRIPCPGHFMARRHHKCLQCNAKDGPVRSLKMYLLTFPRRCFCRYVSANIVPTMWLATVLKLPNTVSIYHGVPNNNGFATRQSSKSATFVFVGRLVTTKGVDVLLRAAYRLRTEGLSFRVKIVGDGPERPRLEALRDALGLRDCVAFEGYLHDPTLDQDLADAVGVIVPSLAGEVFGLVAAEQMIRGRLVIAADTGGLGEVVGDAGLKFAVGDASSLAEFSAGIVTRIFPGKPLPIVNSGSPARPPIQPGLVFKL